jgi:hypothetical protein
VREALKMSMTERSQVLSAIISKITTVKAARLRDHLLEAFSDSASIEIVKGFAHRWIQFCAVLNRSASDELRMWFEPLTKSKRAEVLDLLIAFLPAIETVGAPTALAEFAEAIVSTGAGWP